MNIETIYFSLVAGDVMVVQPSFIFGNSQHQPQQSNNVSSLEPLISKMLPQDASLRYSLGVCLCLYSAAAISAANIVQLKLKERDSKDGLAVTRNHLILSAGAWNLLLSASTLPVLPNTLLTSPLTMSLVTLAMLLVSGVLTLVAMWMMVSAVGLTQHPTLVSMVRSTEIVMSLVTESIYWSHLPNTLSAMGSLLVRQPFILSSTSVLILQVMFSIVAMAKLDTLNDFLARCRPGNSGSFRPDNSVVFNINVDKKSGLGC